MLFDSLADTLRLLPPHLRALHRPDIGTQILYDDGGPIRIPHDGNGKPHFDDTAYFTPLDKAVGIGVNGWCWTDLHSEYATFDLDSLLNHGKGESPERLAEIVAKLQSIPWVEVIRSKSGHGYHVRIYFDPFPYAATHTEHAHNAQRALAHLSNVTGLDLQAAVDMCGAIAWIWHRDTAPGGFALVKSATQKLDLATTPELEPELPKEGQPDAPETIKLTAKHRELIAYLQGQGTGEWDNGRLNTHTAALRQTHDTLDLKGEFETVATGKRLPADRNCFAYPGPRGTWIVFRHGKGTKEADTWHTTPNGWTACYLNKATKATTLCPAGTIVSEALEIDKLFTWEGVAYVQVTRRDRSETLMVAGETYLRLLRIRYRNFHHQVAKGEWIRNAVDQLAAIAIEEGEEIPVYVRIAFVGGKLYIDLCDRDRNIVEIDADGYRIIKEAPVRFLRTDRMLALPIPQPGGKLEDLKPFVNIEGDDFPLLVGVIIGALHPTGPYPIVSLIGGDGRAKTCLAIVLLMLIDPSIVKGCSPPEKSEDLILAVQQRWVYFIDNLDEVKAWLSDSLCRLSTGSASERRTLYKNSDTSVFRAKRPVILTSIKDVVKAPDLNSRTVKFDLPRLNNHTSEAQLWQAFEKARPAILGAIYTAVSAAIRNLPHTKVDNLPRLADFCLWVQAAESATGLPEGSILETYRQAREAAVGELLSADIAQTIIAFATPDEWEGTGKELADALKMPFTRDQEVKDFVSELRTLQTALESQGVLVAFRRSHGKKLITIKKT